MHSHAGFEGKVEHEAFLAVSWYDVLLGIYFQIVVPEKPVCSGKESCAKGRIPVFKILGKKAY